MTEMTSRWFNYGEPVDNDRVEATIRQTYDTGPNEHKDDRVTRGTVGYEALDMMDTNPDVIEHTHMDGNVLLSALDNDTEEQLLETFEEQE